MASASVASASGAAKRMTARQLRANYSLVDRFLVREQRIKAAADAHGVESLRQHAGVTSPQPCKPYTSPLTQRKAPPRLSLRRQAQLGKEAYRDGRFDELVDSMQSMNLKLGPKLHKMQVRIHELRRQEAEKSSEKTSVDVQEQPTERTAVEARAHTPRLAPVRARKEAALLAKALASTHGPYQGRPTRMLFKGHKHEREAPKRKAAVAEKMKGMRKVIRNFRWSRRLRSKLQGPKLPF